MPLQSHRDSEQHLDTIQRRWLCIAGLQNTSQDRSSLLSASK